MPDFTVWYSIVPFTDIRSSMKCPFNPTDYPEGCATEIAECLHCKTVDSYDCDTIIIYESEDGPEVGRYELSEYVVVRYSACKVEADHA